MSKKNGLTLPRHEALGLELQTMRDDLCQIYIEVGKAYPRKTKATIHAFKAGWLIDTLRGILEDRLFEENPNIESLAGFQVYYRTNKPGYKLSEFYKSFDTRTGWAGRTRKKPRFSLTQHEALGLELQSMRDNLVMICVELNKAYPQQSKISTLAERAGAEVDNLRSVLDDQLFKENPGLDRQTAPLVYYLANRADYTLPEFSRNFATDQQGQSLNTGNQVAA